MTHSSLIRRRSIALAITCAVVFVSACGPQSATSPSASDPTDTSSVTPSDLPIERWDVVPNPDTVFSGTLYVADGIFAFASGNGSTDEIERSFAGQANGLLGTAMDGVMLTVTGAQDRNRVDRDEAPCRVAVGEPDAVSVEVLESAQSLPTLHSRRAQDGFCPSLGKELPDRLAVADQ